MKKLKELLQDVRLWEYVTILFVSFLVLLLCSANSFLYAFNDWCDLNWYITMGRGMLEGRVIYKDLFDHKGPIIYFLFSFVALFKNPYHIVFILEVISFSIFLFMLFCFSKKHLKYWLSVVCVIIMAALVPTSRLFVAGGGALEEWFLPIYFYFLILLKQVIETNRLTTKQSILIGCFGAIAFWSKYTIASFLVFAVIACFCIFLIKKQYKELLKSFMFMFLGFVIVTACVFIYFLATNSVKYLIDCYFYDNLVRYTSGFCFPKFHFLNWFNRIVIILGIILSIIKFKKSELFVTGSVLLTILILSITESRVYAWFVIFSFIAYYLVYIVQILNNANYSKWLQLAVIIICVIGASIYCLYENNNKYELGNSKHDYVQYQVADYVKKRGGESLYCYQLCDYGFYNALDMVPEVRFYAKSNFSKQDYPEMYECFDDVIKNKKADYVLMFESDYMLNKDYFEQTYSFEKTFAYEYYEVSEEHFEMRFCLLKAK